MHKKVKSEKVCGVLLNCIATSQVFLLVFIDDFVVPESNFEFSSG